MFKRRMAEGMVFLIAIISMVIFIPTCSLAGTYSYSSVGTTTFSTPSSGYLYFYVDGSMAQYPLTATDTRYNIKQFTIAVPLGSKAKRLAGTWRLNSSSWSGGSFWTPTNDNHGMYHLILDIYGIRDDGSISSEYRTISHDGKYDETVDKTFDMVFNENYSNFYVQESVSYSNNRMKASDSYSCSTSSVGATGTIECFTGIYNIEDIDVNSILNAANAAKASADAAKVNAVSANTNAANAYGATYNSNGNTITAVRDAGGTVLSEARQAKTNSQNAYNTALTVSTKIDSLSNAVTNIQNNLGSDTSPPLVKITTVSGAVATSAASIRAVINASDNVSTFFEYSLDGAWYQTLPQDGVISLPLSRPGSNLVTVWVRDEAGNIGRESISIRKL